jgi:cytochrome b561
MAEAEKAAKTVPKPTPYAPRYARGFAVLHWLVALLLVVAYALTEARAAMTGLQHEWLRAAHIQAGLLFLLLMAVRLAWLPWSNAPGPTGSPGFFDRLTYGTHGLLYLLMALVPLTGMMSWMLHAQPLSILGLAAVPSLLSEQSSWLVPLAKRLHEVSAHALIMLASIHTIGALTHHFILRDRLMSRMSIW